MRAQSIVLGNSESCDRALDGRPNVEFIVSMITSRDINVPFSTETLTKALTNTPAAILDNMALILFRTGEKSTF